MKIKYILTLFFFTAIFAQEIESSADVIQYGYNYTGDFKDGKRHGRGKFIYPNGDTYEGEWKNDVREGEGIFTYKSDSYTYVGSFKNGLRDGK